MLLLTNTFVNLVIRLFCLYGFDCAVVQMLGVHREQGAAGGLQSTAKPS